MNRSNGQHRPQSRNYNHPRKHANEHEHEHGHDHSHGGVSLRNLVILSGLIYVAAFFLEGRIPDALLVAWYLVAIVISGYSTFFRGLRHLFRFKFDINTLMTIALIGAVSIGEWKEAALVAILFGVNELLEEYGNEKAQRSMKALLQAAPKEAVILEEGGERIVPVTALRAGTLVIVKPGEKIPSDGTVVDGKSSVNEAAITGESLPVDKWKDQKVFGGSLNNEGVLQIRIEKAYRDSSLAKILHLVQEAEWNKTPTELFINRFAKYYTPLILCIAAVVMAVPPLLFHGNFQTWFYQGLAVLIVGCPCSLILASPIAILSGITRNARNGILIKGGAHLEQLGKINILALDKTGTLTTGHPVVEEMVVLDQARFLPVAATIEHRSSHPLAKAIMGKVKEMNIPADRLHLDDLQTLPGQGIKAIIDGEPYWLGNEKAMSHLSIPIGIRQQISGMKSRGLTIVMAADQINLLGMFGIADAIREESRQVIAALHRFGIRETIMLTGDHPAAAQKVAAATGVTSYYSNLLPEHKAGLIRQLARKGRVAMVGDGINDAPALASASLGIAMGKGTDSAIETADIVLMQDHLGKLPTAILTARRVSAIIRFNIVVSLGLKLCALLLTIPGLLTLWMAILSDMGATIFVTLVSLTLLIPTKSGKDQPGHLHHPSRPESSQTNRSGTKTV